MGTVYDVHSAKRWLAGTFLYVRLGQNPSHYKLDGDTAGQSLDDRIEQICRKDISQLQNAQLVSVEGKLESTELGDAMARYYIKFKTMERIVRLEPRSKMSEIVSTSSGCPGVQAPVALARAKRLSYLRWPRQKSSTRFA